MADHLDLIADIESGHYDEYIVEVVSAFRARAATAAVGSRWRISLDGDVWDEDTVTGGEIRMVARALGVDWPADPLDSAETLASWVVAHYHKVLGMNMAEAVEKADAFDAKTLIAAVSEFQVAGPNPKDRPASTS